MSNPSRSAREHKATARAAGAVSGEIAQTCDKVVVAATRFLKEGREILVASSTAEAPKPPPKRETAKAEGKVSGKEKASRGVKAAPAPPPGAPEFNP